MPDLSAVDVVGFFGAILGAAVVLFANRVERLRDAAMRLRSLLLKNGHDIWNGGREPIEVVNSNYIEVQAAYLDLRRMALWRRKRLDDAWVAYSGTPHYRDIPDSEPWKAFARGPVLPREAAMHLIARFIKAIG